MPDDVTRPPPRPSSPPPDRNRRPDGTRSEPGRRPRRAEPEPGRRTRGADAAGRRPTTAATQKRTRPEDRRRRPWLVPVAVVGALVVGELGARWVGPEVPRRAGSEERVFIKAEQMHARPRGSTAVLLLGSSETAGGLDPEVLADEAPMLDGFYNGALAGTRPADLDEWASRVALPALDPDVVVIGMLPMGVWRDDGQLPDANVAAAAAYRSAFDQVDPGHLGRRGWWIREHSALVRYRPSLRSPSLTYQGLLHALGVRSSAAPAPTGRFGMDWKTETDPRVVAANTRPTGQVDDYLSRSLPVDEDRDNAETFALMPSEGYDFTRLESLVETIRERGATPVVALAPMDRVVLEAGGLELAPFDRLVERIQEWGADHGVPVHDGFTADRSPDEFHDRTHVDAAGAEAWSREVGRWLAERCTAGDLPAACSSAS